MPTTYRVRRPILVGVDTREPGDLVPEAKDWFRVQHLVHTGLIEEMAVDDDELLAALSYCPDMLPVYGYPAIETFDQPPTEPLPAIETFDSAEPLLLADQDDLVDDDGPSLISQEPGAGALDVMPWPALRKLGAAAGLGRKATRDEIITHLRKA